MTPTDKITRDELNKLYPWMAPLNFFDLMQLYADAQQNSCDEQMRKYLDAYWGRTVQVACVGD